MVLLPLRSSVGWCRLAFSFFGWCFFLGTSSTQWRERKAARPKEAGQPSPPAREGRESSIRREEGGKSPPPTLGGVASFPLHLDGAALSSRPLGGAVFHLTSVLLWVVVLSSPARLGLVLFFREPAKPKRGRRRPHDQKKEEAKPLHPKRRHRKAVPLNGRRDHHSTELNFSSVFLTNLLLFF